MAYATPRGIRRANGYTGVTRRPREEHLVETKDEASMPMPKRQTRFARLIAIATATGGILSHKQNVG